MKICFKSRQTRPTSPSWCVHSSVKRLTVLRVVFVCLFVRVQLKNCGLSSDTLAALAKRNITALFPIQKHVFDPAMKGRDLIGRAKTGSGKTLAFAIPVVENLLKVGGT